MALDGMERLLKEHFPGKKVHLIRFADDFLVTADSQETALQCKETITEFLNERGLELSEEKTKIVHINDGFDFLGRNFRKFRDKGYVYDLRRKAIAAITQKLNPGIIKSAKTWKQDDLIKALNPVIRGWAMYHIRYHQAQPSVNWIGQCTTCCGHGQNADIITKEGVG